jgi:hypothetical protein
MKTRPMLAESFMRAGGRTERHDETIVAFRNFANCPKNGRYSMGLERVDYIDLAQDKTRSVMINFITLYNYPEKTEENHVKTQ